MCKHANKCIRSVIFLTRVALEVQYLPGINFSIVMKPWVIIEVFLMVQSKGFLLLILCTCAYDVMNPALNFMLIKTPIFPRSLAKTCRRAFSGH